MTRRGPRALRWLALPALAVLLAACSGNPKAAPPPSASPAASSGGSTTSTSSSPANPIPRSWTIESVDASGATWTTTVAIGNVISGHAITAYTTRYGNPCNVDRTTDAIVPFVVTTTSTTSGDLAASGDQKLEIVNSSLGVAPDGSNSAQGGQGTQSNAGFAAGEELRAAEESSNGSTCANLDPPGQAMSFGKDSLTGGQAAVLKGYFHLKQWAASSQHGDTSWLSNIWIFVPSNGSGWETTSVGGPAVVSLLDYTPTPTYDSYETKNFGYGWVFPIDGTSQPDCASAASTSPSGSSMPSVQALCEALPEEVVMGYLNSHTEITNAIGRALTGITSEHSMTFVFNSLRAKGEIEMVPGKSGSASEWQKKESG